MFWLILSAVAAPQAPPSECQRRLDDLCKTYGPQARGCVPQAENHGFTCTNSSANLVARLAPGAAATKQCSTKLWRCFQSPEAAGTDAHGCANSTCYCTQHELLEWSLCNCTGSKNCGPPPAPPQPVPPRHTPGRAIFSGGDDGYGRCWFGLLCTNWPQSDLFLYLGFTQAGILCRLLSNPRHMLGCSRSQNSTRHADTLLTKGGLT